MTIKLSIDAIFNISYNPSLCSGEEVTGETHEVIELDLLFTSYKDDNDNVVVMHMNLYLCWHIQQ